MDKKRFKNPWFWIGIVGVVLTAMGVDANTLTSWAAVGQSLLNVITNPVLLGTGVLAVLGVFVNPTTSGFTDDELKIYTKGDSAK